MAETDKRETSHAWPTLQSDRQVRLVAGYSQGIGFALMRGLADAGREQQRSKSGSRRTGQTDHMFGIPDGSKSNGYQKRGRKPGRRTDFMNYPQVIAKRQRALARMEATE